MGFVLHTHAYHGMQCECVCACVCALTDKRKQSNCQDVQKEDVHNRTKAVQNVHHDPGDSSQYMNEHNTQRSHAYVNTITLANQIHFCALRMSNKLRGIQVQAHAYVRTVRHNHSVHSTMLNTNHYIAHLCTDSDCDADYYCIPHCILVNYCLALHINSIYVVYLEHIHTYAFIWRRINSNLIARHLDMK